MNRQNNINMGGNGEDTHAHTAGRVCVPESGQKHSGIYSTGGRPARPVQVAKGAGQIGHAAFESGWLFQRPQGMATNKIKCSKYVIVPPSHVTVTHFSSLLLSHIMVHNNYI